MRLRPAPVILNDRSGRPAPVILNDRSGEVRLGVQRVQKHGDMGSTFQVYVFLVSPWCLSTHGHPLLEFSPLASACICTCACVCVRVLVYDVYVYVCWLLFIAFNS